MYFSACGTYLLTHDQSMAAKHTWRVGPDFGRNTPVLIKRQRGWKRDCTPPSPSMRSSETIRETATRRKDSNSRSTVCLCAVKLGVLNKKILNSVHGEKARVGREKFTVGPMYCSDFIGSPGVITQLNWKMGVDVTAFKTLHEFSILFGRKFHPAILFDSQSIPNNSPPTWS